MKNNLISEVLAKIFPNKNLTVRTLITLVVLSIIGCKQELKKDGEYLELENCIKENFAKNEEIKHCLNGYNYKIDGYILKDSSFFISNFIDEPMKTDSLPNYVLMAYGIEGKSCQIRTDVNFKVEKRFWVKNGSDSIFTILKVF
jgi:hypothetical protein